MVVAVRKGIFHGKFRICGVFTKNSRFGNKRNSQTRAKKLNLGKRQKPLAEPLQVQHCLCVFRLQSLNATLPVDAWCFADSLGPVRLVLFELHLLAAYLDYCYAGYDVSLLEHLTINNNRRAVGSIEYPLYHPAWRRRRPSMGQIRVQKHGDDKRNYELKSEQGFNAFNTGLLFNYLCLV